MVYFHDNKIFGTIPTHRALESLAALHVRRGSSITLYNGRVTRTTYPNEVGFRREYSYCADLQMRVVEKD